MVLDVASGPGAHGADQEDPSRGRSRSLQIDASPRVTGGSERMHAEPPKGAAVGCLAFACGRADMVAMGRCARRRGGPASVDPRGGSIERNACRICALVPT